MASFRDGFKIADDGSRVRAVRYIERQSSSSPTLYTATLWADGTASCNCPGWTRRIADGHRECKHSKELWFWDGRAPKPVATKPWIEESDARAAAAERDRKAQKVYGTPAQVQKNRYTVTRLPDRFILVRDQKVAAPKPERARAAFDEEV